MGMEPEICVHSLSFIRKIVDLIRGQCDDAKVEVSFSHALEEVQMASGQYVD